MTTYTTVQGDRWDLIAYKTLGSENYMSKIIETNIHLRREFIFPAGIELIIPDVETPVDDNVPPWRR